MHEKDKKVSFQSRRRGAPSSVARTPYFLLTCKLSTKSFDAWEKALWQVDCSINSHVMVFDAGIKVLGASEALMSLARWASEEVLGYGK
jgi:hypothetical protein